MFRSDDYSPTKRVNISITENTHIVLKKHAQKNGTTVSQLITNLIWAEEDISPIALPARDWIKGLKPDTISRIVQYCDEQHTTPSQAITSWIWHEKVKGSVMPGQRSLFSQKD